MNLLEKIRTKPDLQDPSNQHSETTAKSTSVMRILRLVLPVVIAGAALCLSAGSPVFAKAGHQQTRRRHQQSILPQWKRSTRWAPSCLRFPRTGFSLLSIAGGSTMSELRSSVAESFSLTQGGPFYRLQVKFGHAQNERARVFNRALVGMIVAWLPLLVLSIVQGTAYGKQVQIPFLRDFAVHSLSRSFAHPHPRGISPNRKGQPISWTLERSLVRRAKQTRGFDSSFSLPLLAGT